MASTLSGEYSELVIVSSTTSAQQSAALLPRRGGERSRPLSRALGWADIGARCARAARLRDCCAPGLARSAVATGMLALAAGSREHELSRSRNLPGKD